MARAVPRIPPDRDLSIDFVRAICLPVVVLLHALQWASPAIRSGPSTPLRSGSR